MADPQRISCRMPPHITVCICTYRRPELLKGLLEKMRLQETNGLFSVSISITDNDDGMSGKEVVDAFGESWEGDVYYEVETRRSISHARNSSLRHANGEFAAFIDDDEFPSDGWLLGLFKQLEADGGAGVLGPVRPFYDSGTPEWVRRSGIYDRIEHPTGYVLKGSQCRTGNVLIRTEIIRGVSPVFRPEFGTGGSDIDFFQRMMADGRKFTWCNEAFVFEHVPPNRSRKSSVLKRALLRGQNAAKLPGGKTFVSLSKSLVAIVLYGVALPILIMRGHHYFMKYSVKICDHLGKILGSFGLNLIKKRTM